MLRYAKQNISKWEKGSMTAFSNVERGPEFAGPANRRGFVRMRQLLRPISQTDTQDLGGLVLGQVLEQGGSVTWG